MTLLALAALLGTVLPLLIAVVQQEKWPARVRAAVTLALVAVAAAGLVLSKGLWHGWNQASIDAYGTAFAGLILATWGTYSHLWSQLGLTQWIEKVTTFTKANKDLVGAILGDIGALSPLDRAAITAALVPSTQISSLPPVTASAGSATSASPLATVTGVAPTPPATESG
ncbi:MAG TPA: hypothetical protein VGL75_00985 [Acidothermaceae bacterium]|jgi:hypothetical protein